MHAALQWCRRCRRRSRSTYRANQSCDSDASMVPPVTTDGDRRSPSRAGAASAASMVPPVITDGLVQGATSLADGQALPWCRL